MVGTTPVSRTADARGVGLSELTDEELTAASDLIEAGVRDVLGAANALAANHPVGGPAPARVREQVERWQRTLNEREDG